MNPSHTLRALVRRWYVVLPLLVLTTALATQAYSSAQPTYTVVSNVAVLPPDEARVRQLDGSVETVPVNPFLNFTGSTQTAAAALALIASSDEFRAQLPDETRGSPFSVVVPPRNPTLELSVQAQDPGRGIAAAAALAVGLDEELARRQAGVPDAETLSVTVLTAPAVSAVDNARLRAAAVVGIGGAAVAVVVGLGLEALALRRRTRQLSGRDWTPLGGADSQLPGALRAPAGA